MAHHVRHHHPRVNAPRWASKTVRFGRSLEGMMERHWPFAAWTLATLGLAAYIVTQLARIAA
jgi:hypothetical protein